MHLNQITETFLDFPDFSSLAVIVYFEGCIHNCPGCQNKELQIPSSPDIEYFEVAKKIKEYCKKSHTTKVVLSGGDPLYDSNIIQLVDLLNDEYDICIYTGYPIDFVKELFKNNKKPHYFKCGRYEETLRDPNMGKTNDSFILASKNQAFYEWDGFDYKKISENNILWKI